MRVLTQTGQVLASVLDDSYADKINSVVNSLLDQLREHILKDSGIPDLMEVMSAMNKRVRRINRKGKNAYETHQAARQTVTKIIVENAYSDSDNEPTTSK